MKSYVIHLIRNAPCEGNFEGRYIGRTESPIAEQGIKQLLDLKREYNYPDAQGFYASPSTRCVDTLKLLYPEADPEVIFEMAECDFGDWENKNAEDLKDDENFRAWIENGSTTAPPNGESGAVVMQRVLKGFEMLVDNVVHRGETSSVLVTHGGAIMTILAAYGLPKAEFYEWMCEPCCGYSIRITPSLWMRGNVVEVFDVIPRDNNHETPDHIIVDVAREAADRAYGKSGED